MLLMISLTGLGMGAAKATLTVFSILSVAVIVERALTLGRARAAEEAAYRELLDSGDAGSLAKRLDAAAGQAPCVIALRAGLNLPNVGALRRMEAVGQEIAVQAERLQGRLTLLGTIASTAPYIGLFGTVLGILQAFHEIALSGKTGASVVAGGISEALLTTALGLGVAIPAVIAYNWLSGKVNALTLDVETHVLDLAARLPALNDALPSRAAAAIE